MEEKFKVLLIAGYNSLRVSSFMRRKIILQSLRYESERARNLLPGPTLPREAHNGARTLTGRLCRSKGECDSNISSLQIIFPWLIVDPCLYLRENALC